MAKSHEIMHGTCLCCIPLKVGVFLYGMFMLTLSVMAVASLATEDWRLLVGGFTYGTRGVVTVVGVCGLILSAMCLLGVYDNKSDWVRNFARFAFLRVATLLAVLYFDWGALSGCEGYAAGGDKFSSLNGPYNVALETVALSGTCESSRKTYLILTIVDIIVSFIGAYNSSRWCHIIDNGPTYHISLDEASKVHQGYASLGRPAVARRPEYGSGFYSMQATPAP